MLSHNSRREQTGGGVGAPDRTEQYYLLLSHYYQNPAEPNRTEQYNILYYYLLLSHYYYH